MAADVEYQRRVRFKMEGPPSTAGDLRNLNIAKADPLTANARCRDIIDLGRMYTGLLHGGVERAAR